MSQKLILVKYELEDGTPIDESSENLSATHAPKEFVDWAAENKFLSEVYIKESAGEVADIPISTINCGVDTHLEEALKYIEAKLIQGIETAHTHISGDVLITKELDDQFSILLIWLNLRDIIKEKMANYRNNDNIKLVIG